MTVVGLDEVIFWELEVDFKVLLGPDGPDTVDGGVVGSTVLQSVCTDVGGANKVLFSINVFTGIINYLSKALVEYPSSILAL